MINLKMRSCAVRCLQRAIFKHSGFGDRMSSNTANRKTVRCLQRAIFKHSGFGDRMSSNTANRKTGQPMKTTIPELTTEDIHLLEGYRTISHDVLGRILQKADRKSSFTYRELTDIPAEDAQDLLTRCFTKKGAFASKCSHPEHQLGYEEFCGYLQMFWPLFLEHSFGLLDKEGQLVAVAAQADEFEIPKTLEAQASPSQVERALRYMMLLEEKAGSRLPEVNKKGTWMQRALSGVLLDKYSTPENVYVMGLLAREQHRRNAERHYQYSIAESAHPITQRLARHFKCEQLLLEYPRDHMDEEGNKPFACLDKKVFVDLNLKKYD